jgi:hypothetical protein
MQTSRKQWRVLHLSPIDFHMSGKTPELGKNNLVNTWHWDKRISTCKEEKHEVEGLLLANTKINSEFIKYLNVRVKTIKLLEKKHKT